MPNAIILVITREDMAVDMLVSSEEDLDLLEK